MEELLGEELDDPSLLAKLIIAMKLRNMTK
ncbi:TPA: hypothetical protein ACGE8T_003089 [Klebsiella pneumoniae]